MSAERLIQALGDYDLNPTEIADILWLALRQPREESQAEPELEPSPPPPPMPPSSMGSSVPDDSGTDEPILEDDSEANQEPTVEIASQAPSGILPKKALPISVPDPGFVEETLPFVRALRPLLKQIDSKISSHINEAATVDRIAETDIWSPILQPDQEPWFEVALVIDSSPAMSLWQRLIKDIQRLLRCYGSFRDFRVWELTITNRQVGICAVPDRVPRSPKTLLSPDARRLTLVFSDCTASYWWDGTLQPVLKEWGASMPTTIWQVLPDWMWKRTALGVGEYVVFRNRIPGARNKALTPIFLSLRPPKRLRERNAEQAGSLATSVCVPVITTDSDSISAWSSMLSGDRRRSTPGFILPATGWEQPKHQFSKDTDNAEPDAPDASNDDTSNQADEPLEQFRLRATPAARRLAALLSAAPVITLPVMRLICASMLPGTSPLPVAEVFLGGVLKRAPDQPDTVEAELVQYVFPTETRDRLLDVLPKIEAISVIEAVSQHVAERLNCTLVDFRALLLSPDLKAEANEYGLKAFATVTAQILRRLGREYEALADQLEYAQKPEETHQEEDRPEWPDFPLESFEYEVAEFVNFPPLETFEFIDAQLVEKPSPEFPPPLQTEEFTIVTLELQPEEDNATPELETFNFTVATIIRDGTGWQIQRQQQQARRFIEHLSEDMLLKMVQISGGTFLMGSPEDEPERNAERESPQHEVTIQPFYMGRYPITQAQWKVVVAMPQVERELKPDPSRFKGDNRPVESVSWHEAVEFCQRLSRHTGREYRLPTEAEWEYACRAGTTTPFHFGETISPELANYDARQAYADGPTGEYREETTPAPQFQVANAFGLSDMHGNVLEWCQDHWHDSYEGAPGDGSAWIEGGHSRLRVRRGGSWFSIPRGCRSAFRLRSNADNRGLLIGFRVVCSAPRILQ